MRAQPLIVVRDVEASSRFYRRILGCESGRSDGLILQLHAWDVDHHHGPMELGAPVVRDVHVNPNPNPAHRELWIADPDGYTVVLASPDGEAASPKI